MRLGIGSVLIIGCLSMSMAYGAQEQVAQSVESASSLSQYFISGNGGVGYSSASVSQGMSSPTILQFNLGATGAYKFSSSWMLGLSSDFSFINQYSDTATSGANYRGTRWNMVSPTVGFVYKNLTILADAEFLGNYRIYLAAANGGDVAFSSPLGGRIRGTYPVAKNINAGWSFEYMTFGNRTNSISGDATLDSKQKLWELGAVVSYIY